MQVEPPTVFRRRRRRRLLLFFLLAILFGDGRGFVVQITATTREENDFDALQQPLVHDRRVSGDRGARWSSSFFFSFFLIFFLSEKKRRKIFLLLDEKETLFSTTRDESSFEVDSHTTHNRPPTERSGTPRLFLRARRR